MNFSHVLGLDHFSGKYESLDFLWAIHSAGESCWGSLNFLLTEGLKRSTYFIIAQVFGWVCVSVCLRVRGAFEAVWACFQ